MDENLNLISLVIDELNKNDMWFTTKNDPTIQEPKDYYKLDEFGNPTDNTIKKIEKEVTSLIGDGAVDINDAIDLWINDALVDCKIDYRDNLVTVFKDRQVVDNIEAYENPVQFPQTKRVESKSIKREDKYAVEYRLSDTGEVVRSKEFDNFTDAMKYQGDIVKKLKNKIDYCEYVNLSESKKLQEHTETMLKSVDADSHWVKPFVDLFKSKYSDAPIDKIYIEVVEGGWQPCTAFIVSGYDTYRVYVASLNDGIYMSDKDDIRTVRGDFKRDYDYVEESKKKDFEKSKSKKTEDIETNLPKYGGRDLADFKAMLQTFDKNGRFARRGSWSIGNGGYDLYWEIYYNKLPVIRDVAGKVENETQDEIYEQYAKLVADIYNEKFVDNKVEESKSKKTEGAGAGYEISGSISNAHVNSFNVDNVERTKYNERVVTITCDVDVDLDDLYFASYYYGGKTEFPVKAKITSLRMTDNDSYEDEDDEPEVDDYNIKDALNGTTFRTILGGGWVHQTFDGTFESDAEGNTYSSYFYTDFISVKIPSDMVVKFIDEKVSGTVDESTYEVFDMDSDILDSFDDEDAAIEFAKNNNGVQVVRVMHNFSLTDEEGSVDDDPDYETVWERDYDRNYKFDTNESKKVENFVNDDGIEITDDDNSGFTYAKIFVDFFVSDKENASAEVDKFLNRYLTELSGKKVTIKSMLKYLEDWNYHTYVNEFENKLKENELMECDKNFKLRTKDKVDENYQKRLDEVNNKSKGLIDDMVSKDDFDETSAYGRIVMRTAHMFDVLSENGYDVDVTFDNGESTSAIQLGPQGGKIMITITDAEKPLRAFTSGNFEVNDDILETLNDVQNILDTL